MSEHNLGPKLVFQNNDYRIEHFFNGRPMTIWEMREPANIKLFTKALFEFHHQSGIAEKVQTVSPLDRNNLFFDHIIDDWGSKSLLRIEKIRAKLDVNQNASH